MIALAALPVDAYVRDVLPHSAAEWAGARDQQAYEAEFRALAASSFGKRRLRTIGLFVDGALVASCKRYARVLRCGDRTYDAAGIGAVFTPRTLRGRGYATALLGALLDAERASGTDVAYLFSDIHPAFYKRLGFASVPSRLITLPAAALDLRRLPLAALGAADEGIIARVFEAADARRAFSFRRSALDWEWQRLRNASAEHPDPIVRLGVRRGRGLAAYVAGRRIVAADAFVVDEFAYARESDDDLIEPLLRAAAGDLRKIQGWLPPLPARDALPRGAVRRRQDAVLMLLPLSPAFAAAFRRNANEIAASAGDPCWATDHI